MGRTERDVKTRKATLRDFGEVLTDGKAVWGRSLLNDNLWGFADHVPLFDDFHPCQNVAEMRENPGRDRTWRVVVPNVIDNEMNSEMAENLGVLMKRPLPTSTRSKSRKTKERTRRERRLDARRRKIALAPQFATSGPDVVESMFVSSTAVHCPNGS